MEWGRKNNPQARYLHEASKKPQAFYNLRLFSLKQATALGLGSNIELALPPFPRTHDADLIGDIHAPS